MSAKVLGVLSIDARVRYTGDRCYHIMFLVQGNEDEILSAPELPKMGSPLNFLKMDTYAKLIHLETVGMLLQSKIADNLFVVKAIYDTQRSKQ